MPVPVEIAAVAGAVNVTGAAEVFTAGCVDPAAGAVIVVEGVKVVGGVGALGTAIIDVAAVAFGILMVTTFPDDPDDVSAKGGVTTVMACNAA